MARSLKFLQGARLALGTFLTGTPFIACIHDQAARSGLLGLGTDLTGTPLNNIDHNIWLNGKPWPAEANE